MNKNRKDITSNVHTRLNQACDYFLILDCFDVIALDLFEKFNNFENVLIPGFGIFYPQVHDIKPSKKRYIKFTPDQKFVEKMNTYIQSKEKEKE